MHGNSIRGSGHIRHEIVQQCCIVMVQVVDFAVRPEELERDFESFGEANRFLACCH